MAALAVPAIEAVVARVLVVLGVGAAVGAAGDAARKRQKEADDARSTPIARTDAQTKSKEKCKECPPDAGAPSIDPQQVGQKRRLLIRRESPVCRLVLASSQNGCSEA